MTFTKSEYKHLKALAKLYNVKTVSSEVLDDTYAGLCVAYRPAIDSKDCRMLEVAVSYCANEDKYSRKVGKYVAVRKMFNEEVVRIPLAQWALSTEIEEVKERLLTMFAV